MSEMKKSGRRRRTLIRLKINHLRQDHGNGWLGSISRLIAVVRDALPAIDLAIGHSEEEVWQHSNQVKDIDRPLEGFEIQILDEAEQVLAEEAQSVEKKSIQLQSHQQLPKPDEIVARERELQEKVAELELQGWRIEFKPVRKQDEQKEI